MANCDIARGIMPTGRGTKQHARPCARQQQTRQGSMAPNNEVAASSPGACGGPPHSGYVRRHGAHEAVRLCDRMLLAINMVLNRIQQWSPYDGLQLTLAGVSHPSMGDICCGGRCTAQTYGAATCEQQHCHTCPGCTGDAHKRQLHLLTPVLLP